MTETDGIPDIALLNSSVPDLAYVAVKTVGLFYLASCVQYTATYLAVLWQVIDSRFRGATGYGPWIVPPVACGIIGAILVIYAKPISTRIFRLNTNVRIGGQATRIIALITVGIGVYWLASGFTVFAETFVKYVDRTRMLNAGQVESPSIPSIERYHDVYYPIIHSIFGSILFFRPAWIVGQWQKRVQMPLVP